MRFSTLNSKDITQGFIADLIQVDIVYLDQMYFNIYMVFGSTVGTVTSLFFMIFFLGMSQTLIYLVVLLVLVGIYHGSYILHAYIRKRYLEAKDKRMSLLRNLLENIDYVKINGLENYFCLEMYEKRESEISWMKAISILESLQYAILQLMLDWFSSMVFNSIWLFFPVFNMNLSKFYQFYNYSQNTTTGLSGILSGYSSYLNMMVSIRRIDQFMQTEDKDTNGLFDLALAVDDDSDLDSDKTVLKIDDGNFVWRVDQSTYYQKPKELVVLETQDNDLNKNRGTEVSREELIVDTLIKTERQKKVEEISFKLQNINLSIERGEKIAVIGRSSSGTSSLLYAMIGDPC